LSVVCVTVAVGIRIAVPQTSIHRVLVGEGVTVVVVAVAVLRSAGVYVSVTIVAVDPTGHVTGRLRAGYPILVTVAVAVAVRVNIPGAGVRAGVRVGGPVAVVVRAVANFRGARVHLSVGVVAIGRAENVTGGLRAGNLSGVRAIPVAVPIAVPDRSSGVVVRRIAVVVDTVSTHLGYAGVHRGIGVVTIVGVVHKAHKGFAALGLDRTTTVPVAVLVGVPRGGHSFVHVAVTVVIEVVADLDSAGVYVSVGIVAVVGVVHKETRRLTSLQDHVHGAVTVPIQVGVPRRGHTFVHLSVAVVIDLVADLFGARKDGGVGVIAIIIDGITVAISIIDFRIRVGI